MGDMVSKMFGGGGGAQKEAAREAQRQRDLAEIAQQRQAEELRTRAADTDAQTRATGRPARGRKLLAFAGLGEQRLSDKLGG